MRSTSFTLLTCFFALIPEGKAVPLQPHRAQYRMILEKADPSSGLQDVSGTLTNELLRTCNGWIVQQTSNTKVFTGENETENILWGYAIWESKDHKQLRFNTYRRVDDVLTDEFRGSANLSTQTAVYKSPLSRKLMLPKNTVFPVAHLKETLQRAKKGEVHISQTLFDGSSAEGFTSLNSYIMSPFEISKGKVKAAKGQVYPIQIAIFEPENETIIPNYETVQHILENGVVTRYTVFYNGFSVSGQLEELEYLDDPDCGKK